MKFSIHHKSLFDRYYLYLVQPNGIMDKFLGTFKTKKEAREFAEKYKDSYSDTVEEFEV